VQPSKHIASNFGQTLTNDRSDHQRETIEIVGINTSVAKLRKQTQSLGTSLTWKGSEVRSLYRPPVFAPAASEDCRVETLAKAGRTTDYLAAILAPIRAGARISGKPNRPRAQPSICRRTNCQKYNAGYALTYHDPAVTTCPQQVCSDPS
jgi:hypothetical protein